MTDSITPDTLREAADKLAYGIPCEQIVHTVTFSINGQHGKVDMIVDALEMEADNFHDIRTRFVVS
jgi:hypothetical protein